MNRLSRERSPYLLQHAAQPGRVVCVGRRGVRARRASESKPIFLSVGYSTCHWCHVMEHESFENEAVAAVLNEHFVSIKVDREERPDVDRVYMTFVQATTGSGGWPMSVWLTPDLKPFYGGTYFPPTSRWGRPGFVDILQEIARVWRADRDQVLHSAEAMTTQLRQVERTVGGRDRARRRGAGARRDAILGGVRLAPQRFRRRRPSFPGPASCCFSCASTRAPATPTRATWCCGRFGRWRSAACAITSAAVFTAIRSIRPGAFPISKRCCTTRRSSSWPTSRPRRRRATVSISRSPKTRCSTSCAR